MAALRVRVRLSRDRVAWACLVTLPDGRLLYGRGPSPVIAPGRAAGTWSCEENALDIWVRGRQSAFPPVLHGCLEDLAGVTLATLLTEMKKTTGEDWVVDDPGRNVLAVKAP